MSNNPESTTNPPPRLCIHCKHYALAGSQFGSVSHVCVATSQPCLVTGGISYENCRWMRSESGRCGAIGALWEAR